MTHDAYPGSSVSKLIAERDGLRVEVEQLREAAQGAVDAYFGQPIDVCDEAHRRLRTVLSGAPA